MALTLWWWMIVGMAPVPLVVMMLLMTEDVASNLKKKILNRIGSRNVAMDKCRHSQVDKKDTLLYKI